jgi:hypothetical protein
MMTKSSLSLGLGGRVLALCVGLFGLTTGCATYSESVHHARQSVAAGRPESAVRDLNRVLDVKQAHQLPAKLSGQHTLVLLERATVLQGLGRYELAARDMMLADQRLDWLDIAAANKAKIGKYMFSGTTVRYRAPPYERLLLNALNTINFLALGDVEDAKVEARRFRIIEQFFADDDSKTIQPQLLRFGNYLGGVAFEAAGDLREASRYYTRAWHHGLRYDRFRQRLVELLRITGSGGAGLDSDAIDALLSDARQGEPMSPSTYRKRWVEGELLTIVQSGIVPYKIPQRYPIGRALTIAGTATWGASLEPEQRRRANRLAAQGLVTWINFPTLTDRGLPAPRNVSLRIDQQSTDMISAVDVERQVEHAWERLEPTLMVAAITRMITRTALGVAAGEGVEQASDGNSGFGALTSLLVQGSMAIADKPDTRSWSLLPGRIHLRRMDVGGGTHEVSVRIAGHRQTKTVDVPKAGFRLVNFSRYR